MTLPDTFQVTITKELCEKHDYGDPWACPICFALKNDHPDAYSINEWITRVHIGNLTYYHDRFDEDDYRRILSTGVPLTITLTRIK